MKKCPACHHEYPFAASACPACDFHPPVCDGFPVYASALNSGEGFTPEMFRHLAASEQASFWFQSRNRLIVRALRTYCGGMQSLYETGCGTGFVLAAISKAFPDIRIAGSDIATSGLKYAAERLPPGTPLMQADVCTIPFSEEFDVIAACDVLEHIERDEEAMRSLCSALKPNGFILLTVPQHMWLWSATDVTAGHVRRYTKQALFTRLERAGFRIRYSTSFVFLLLPAMMLSRLTQRKKSGTAELALPVWLNGLCSGCMRVEEVCIRCGMRFPAGGSRLVIAQRV